MLETIAVYWEDPVKVYGISEKFGLVMAELCFPSGRIDYWSVKLIDLESLIPRFELVTCLVADKSRLRLCMVIEASGREALTDQMELWLAEQSAFFTLTSPVDMIFLHGPHFQDRFGIAETAFTALAKWNIPIVHSGCAGTSMYLIVEGGKGVAAKDILTDTFLIPKTV